MDETSRQRDPCWHVRGTGPDDSPALLQSIVPQAYLFDLDQTLIDNAPSLRAFLPDQHHRFAPSFRRSEADAYHRRFMDLDANGYANKRQLYDVLRSEFGIQASVEDLVQDFRTNCYRTVHPFPDATSVLTCLKQRGHPIGIVTNGSTATQDRKIRAAGLSSLVDVVLISGSIGPRKPDPAIFQRAAQELGVDATSCLFAGDDPRKDICGAATVCMRTAWLAHGRTWPTTLEPTPSMTLTALTDLLVIPFHGRRVDVSSSKA